MIYIYTGAVGSGKSYNAIRQIVQKLSAWKNNSVVANFPITSCKNKKIWEKQKERFIYLPNEEITPKKMVELAIEKKFIGHEGSCLLIIDEAGLFFNARDWQQSKDRHTWIKFFSQSRKLGYDLILIAQDLRMIDRQIRSMCDFEVLHKALNKYSFFQLLPVKVFCAVTYWINTRFEGSPEFFILRKKVAKRYDTMKMFDEISGIEIVGSAGGARGRPRRADNKVIS